MGIGPYVIQIYAKKRVIIKPLPRLDEEVVKT